MVYYVLFLNKAKYIYLYNTDNETCTNMFAIKRKII